MTDRERAVDGGSVAVAPAVGRASEREATAVGVRRTATFAEMSDAMRRA